MTIFRHLDILDAFETPVVEWQKLSRFPAEMTRVRSRTTEY